MTTALRVLIVEDSEADAELLLRELRRGGYAPEFERVETPEGLDDALARQSWDLIVSDYAMPHFNGLQALKLTQGKGLDIPFIIVSGSIGEDVAVRIHADHLEIWYAQKMLERILRMIGRGNHKIDYRQTYDSALERTILGLAEPADHVIQVKHQLTVTTGDGEKVILLCKESLAEKVKRYCEATFPYLEQNKP